MIHIARQPRIHSAVDRQNEDREKSLPEASTPTQIVVDSTSSDTCQLTDPAPQ